MPDSIEISLQIKVEAHRHFIAWMIVSSREIQSKVWIECHHKFLLQHDVFDSPGNLTDKKRHCLGLSEELIEKIDCIGF